MDSVRRLGIPLLGLRNSELGAKLLTFQQRLENRRSEIKPEDFSEIMNLVEEEQQYVNRLRKLEQMKSVLVQHGIPDTDLKSLFGLVEDIIKQHECRYLAQLTACRKVEDILEFFLREANAFNVYIFDQWKKSKHEFQGKESVLKRLNSEVVEDLNLPEKRIIQYLNLHEHLKTNFQQLKDSEIFLKSFETVRNTFLQMQYAKELASVLLLPSSADGYVYLVDRFQVKVDNTQFLSYRIYCCTNYLYFVTEAMKFDFDVNNREISLNSMEDDELLFEITSMPTKNRKVVLVLKSETPAIKNAWINILKEILYRQVEEEKSKLKKQK